MATPVDALRKAAGEIGYYAPDDPQPGSKYGRWEADKLGQPWLAGPSRTVWWCVIFISWVLDGLAELNGLPGYNTDALLAAARAEGRVLANPRDAQPGDLVIYDWNKATAVTNHMGIIELNLGAAGIQAIEGNTSSGVAGSQSAGNGVWRRTRSWQYVAAVIRPHYIDAPVETVAQPVVVPTPAPAPAPKQFRDIRPIQRALHTDDDNVWGPDTDQRWRAVVAASIYGGVRFPWGVAYTQRVVGTKDDGAWGPKSHAAHDYTVGLIQDAVGARHDDTIGPETIGLVNAAHAASDHTV